MEDVEDEEKIDAEGKSYFFLLLSLLPPLPHLTLAASHEFELDDEVEDWMACENVDVM